jgi:hypothetical protein
MAAISPPSRGRALRLPVHSPVDMGVDGVLLLAAEAVVCFAAGMVVYVVFRKLRSG